MEPTERISIRGITLAAAVSMLPLVRGTTLHEEPGVSFGIFRLTTLHFFDLFLIVAVGAVIIERRHLRVPRSSVALFAAAIPLVLAISLAFNPSWRGMSMVLRWAAALVLFVAMTSMPKVDLRRYVALPMATMAAAQGALAWMQLITDSDAGFAVLGGAAPRVVNGVARAAGTFAVPYLLAAYALVAVGIAVALRPRPTSPPWLALMAAATIPVAITFSRAALVGLAFGAVVAIGAARRDTSWRPVVVAVLVGFLVPALLNVSSWASRLDETDAAAFRADGSVRYELVEQAVTLAGDNWLVGVGAGRYSLALEDRFLLDERTAHPVHLAPLLVLVEVGLVLGLILAAIGARAGFDVVRRSAETRVLFALPVGFVLFDHLNVTHPIGPVLTMLWLAVLASLLVEDGTPIRAGTGSQAG